MKSLGHLMEMEMSQEIWKESVFQKHKIYTKGEFMKSYTDLDTLRHGEKNHHISNNSND